jgi:hypothetical protein
MMGLITFSGRVSAVKEETNAAGWSWVRFRINNRPVITALRPNLTEGDVVTVVALDMPEPDVLALRNESTGVRYEPVESNAPGFPFFGLGFGILCVPFLIGFLLLWMSWAGYQSRIEMYKREVETRRLLKAAPLAVS